MAAASHTAEKDDASLEKPALKNSPSIPSLDRNADREAAKPGLLDFEPKWYHSVFFNMTILGLCNFSAPGLWGAMNSLGAGGAASPHLINAANALTFCLMVLSCWLGSAFVNLFGVKFTLMFGTAGYCIYAAGLYTNNVFGTTWLVLFGAAACGICAGLFWMIEGAIALSYPSPAGRGKALGYWLCYRVSGQVLGGAINLGINARRSQAGSVSSKVYIVFIALQACGPFIGSLLSPPHKVQRKDRTPVELYIGTNFLEEWRATWHMFFSRKFLLLVPLIWQTVFSESFTGTYFVDYFSVRARALGSFCSAILCMIVGLFEGYLLDRTSWSKKSRARWSFVIILGLQGGWWIYSQIIQQIYVRDHPTLDWTSPGFGRGFVLYLLITVGFQMNYLYMFWVVGSLVEHPRDIIRIAALLRGTESAAQAVSYGINSTALALNAASAINFGLWGLALVPGWLVVRTIGIGKPSSDDLTAEGARSGESVSKDSREESVAEKGQ
ncbi:major facilitator superfamily domain-containing protein [Dichomitus squalens]|uniref:Major facilitator superfamily domain-containing protein n=1 Tax=Dichomitus squalens TaxID=114155 RepID=A0A4Q9NEX9_9APHY|nr:major facilitator superfamily domain-containing protein [Dichomitus squalens]TBU39619.1 major facilitator superfamily domain-containing protein [Dichomitus squalens]